jgi:hypothetical protein
LQEFFLCLKKIFKHLLRINFRVSQKHSKRR